MEGTARLAAQRPSLPAAARALVLQRGDASAANVRIGATHTHGMPTLRTFRQWRAVSQPYTARVEQQIVLAVERAKADLAPAGLVVGKSRAEGADFNRASKTWKTDKEFAKDWFAGASRWDLGRTALPVLLTAMRLGRVGLLFHPAELYSVYGLSIQRDSPLDDTFVVGYTDDIIGYLPDPAAYRNGEYSAIVVPKIIDLPPLRPTAGRVFAKAAVDCMHRVVG